MVKKSTDFEWEPKNKGDKIVSFLLWIIMVVLIIYGALIYKNREELFNLKQVAKKNKPVEEIKIRVKKENAENIEKMIDQKGTQENIKTAVSGNTQTKETESKPPVVPVTQKNPADVPETPVKKDPVPVVEDNKIKVVEVKNTEEKLYVLKVFPFASMVLAKKFYSSLKIDMKDRKVINYEDVFALIVAGFKDIDQLNGIVSTANKQGLTAKIFENNSDAIKTDDLKKEVEDRNSKSNVEKDKLKDKFTIQVVSVKNAANAEALKKKITAETGIQEIFIIPAEKDSNPIYKVRVGMFDTREEAEEKAKVLIQKFEEIEGSWVKKGIYD